MARLLVLISALVYGSSAKYSKRILLTDPDYADSHQMHKDIQNLKALVQQLQGKIQNQEQTIEKFATTGISGGGYYSHKGRAAEPICLPHDPYIGSPITNDYHASLFGMEYQDNFDSNVYNKDVPCAVCRANHVTSKIMIPGKATCYAGWRKEYNGILVAGYHNHDSASSFICVDQNQDVLEAGVANDDGYLIYPVVAKCGSLKCPPYVQDTRISCVVCTNKSTLICIKQTKLRTECEIWTKVQIEGSKNLNIGSFYRNPNGTLEEMESLEESLKNMEGIRSDLESNFDQFKEDVETLWTNFRHLVTETIERNIPSKQTTTRWNLPWMTTEIKQMIRRKHRL
ncbi:unnamed protein product [Mytilus coruscus]|uniref:Uncharacterized protein n=1 Tax=Mytilus coruscus TaxID=42192 RepID=A0A6J8DPG1_MYTCO|nr:unnamed protein product [Mytilus coruscus]